MFFWKLRRDRSEFAENEFIINVKFIIHQNMGKLMILNFWINLNIKYFWNLSSNPIYRQVYYISVCHSAPLRSASLIYITQRWAMLSPLWRAINPLNACIAQNTISDGSYWIEQVHEKSWLLKILFAVHTLGLVYCGACSVYNNNTNFCAIHQKVKINVGKNMIFNCNLIK